MILRWHAVVVVLALGGGVAIAVEAVDIPKALGTSTYYFRPLHLGLIAPLCIVAAWQLAQVGRSLREAKRDFRFASLGALATALGAGVAEVVSRILERDDAMTSVDWPAIVPGLGVLTWVVLANRAVARLAQRLAATTLDLPTVRMRERALHLGAWLKAIPWSFALALVVAIANAGVASAAIAGLGLVAFVGGQLAVAVLLSRSRELPIATASDPAQRR
ncbi:MAG: hypothetical protein H6Q90_889 [Deltaproteobacteria bacterium]|nr:hypothetical protein [Deltaproteobacteria bacterium]